MTREEWRNQVIEDAIEPDLPIIDTHHHIWTETPSEPWEAFPAEALIALKANSRHNVIGTVYVDSHANYRKDGPAALKVVGETEFAGGLGDACAARGGKEAGVCAAVVTHADLQLGVAVGEVLDAHMAASPRFRGIRHMTAIDPDLPPVFGATEYGIMARPAFREGFAELVRRDLTFDAWMFHPQLPELVDLARAFPDARIILDHTGGPMGIGRFAADREAAFTGWKADIAALSQCPNVVVKLGGINMAYSAMDATDKPVPHTSEQVAALQQRHIRAVIELFGPDRCMFESNFPVDMMAISYDVLWNSFKRMTADLTRAEREQLFAGTARKTYRLAI